MKKLSAFILFSFIILFTQCKKYPEGPALSLKSKKERVSNTWKIDKLIINNVDSTTQYTNVFKDYTISINKSGSYLTSYYVTVPFIGNVSNTENGNWAFSGDKKSLNLTPTSIAVGNLPSPSSLQILKLYEKELWLRNVDSKGKVTEYHLLPK